METNRVSTTLVQSLPDRPDSIKQPVDYVQVIGDISTIVLPICFLAFWTITLVMVILKTPKALRDRKLNLRLPGQVPCRNCQFFNSNPYLRCALHPSTVLTPEATTCADYQAHSPLSQTTKE